MSDKTNTQKAYIEGLRAGYEQRKREVEMETVSLAEMCQKHRVFGRMEVIDWVKKHYVDGKAYAHDLAYYDVDVIELEEQKKRWEK